MQYLLEVFFGLGFDPGEEEDDDGMMSGIVERTDGGLALLGVDSDFLGRGGLLRPDETMSIDEESMSESAGG